MLSFLVFVPCLGPRVFLHIFLRLRENEPRSCIFHGFAKKKINKNLCEQGILQP